MRTNREADVIRMMREQWDRRVRRLVEDAEPDLKLDVDGDGEEDGVLSQGLKVIHKDSRIRYTVDSIGPRDVILHTPEGDAFLVDKDTLEKEYSLD